MNEHEVRNLTRPTGRTLKCASVLGGIALAFSIMGFIGSGLFDIIILSIDPIKDEIAYHEMGILWLGGWIITMHILVIGLILGGVSLILFRSARTERAKQRKWALASTIICGVLIAINILSMYLSAYGSSW